MSVASGAAFGVNCTHYGWQVRARVGCDMRFTDRAAQHSNALAMRKDRLSFSSTFEANVGVATRVNRVRVLCPQRSESGRARVLRTVTGGARLLRGSA